MGSMNQSGRHKKEYIGDNLDLKVYPKDCVPENRPHGSWTNGVQAWERGKNGASDKVVGWFYAPRHRNKGWKNRKSRSISVHEEEWKVK